MQKVILFAALAVGVFMPMRLSANESADSAAVEALAAPVVEWNISRSGADVLQDSLQTAATDTAVKKKKNIFGKISDYFADSNKFDPSKKIDFGIIGGRFTHRRPVWDLGWWLRESIRLTKKTRVCHCRMSLFSAMSPLPAC